MKELYTILEEDPLYIEPNKYVYQDGDNKEVKVVLNFNRPSK